MARVKVNFDNKAFSARVTQAFQRVKRSPQLQKEIGEDLVRRIKGQARRGKPYNSARSFPALKSSTISRRKQLAKYNQTGKPFRPRLSNLTLTGQLIDAIKFKANKDFVEIFVEDSAREPYVISSKGTLEKKPPDNNTLAGYLSEKGFQLFNGKGLRNDEKINKAIRSKVVRFLRRALRVERLRG